MASLRLVIDLGALERAGSVLKDGVLGAPGAGNYFHLSLLLGDSSLFFRHLGPPLLHGR